MNHTEQKWFYVGSHSLSDYSVARQSSELTAFPIFFLVLKDNTQNDVEILQDGVKELKKSSDELLQRDVPGKFPLLCCC